MNRTLWKELFGFEGRVDRVRYFVTGTLLLAIKYVVDARIAAHFGAPWHPWNYFVPPQTLSVFTLAGPTRFLYLTLWAVAIPFFWVGVALTMRRLRDAGLRLGWVFLFFVPVVNLIFFLSLCVIPPASAVERQASAEKDAGTLPPAPGRPIIGILVAALIGLALVLLSANLLATYAWGLFLGVPFAIGFIASWFLNYLEIQPTGATITVSSAAVLLAGIALVGFQREGAICLLMALPLAFPFAIGGGLAARRCLDSRRRLSTPGATACIAILPLLMCGEYAANLQPPTEPVVTSVVIAAPASVVWKNVIAFPPLDPPKEWMFRSGIAYPIGATITGAGVGAIRRCRFSTGDFVEPVTVWDENHLLAFNVTSEPPSLHELGFGDIHTPHNDRNYMRSQHGQFRLIAIDANHTRLEGTTWYQDYFWPQVYWRGWSDAIVHRIHTRVLEHIKHQAEAQAGATAD